MAESPVDAIKKERKVEAQEIWLDENQPEATEQTAAIGFRTDDEYFPHPFLKPKKKKRK